MQKKVMALCLRVQFFLTNPVKSNYIIVFSSLSSPEYAHGRGQEFGFGVALKRKVQSHGRYVSAQLMRISLNVHREV